MAEHKEEVVISGIGGLFPECNNITELSDLLFQKKNGVTIDSRRWKPDKLGAISGTGKIKNIDTFDSTFFSVHPKLAKVMDTMTKICLERSIEAIIDAGLSPADLHGTNTGVFMGSAISETEMKAMDTNSSVGFIMLGSSRAMQANRLSFILNLTGPSICMDGGWICGSNGLKKAKEMIENGLLSSAIVGVTNLTLQPEIQFLYEGLNRLTKSDQTKPFSSDADGYNRSEACIVLYLQKASEAKRSYGTLLNVKSMQFGNHDRTLTEHDANHFKSLLLDSYKEADIDPATVDFIEAYGSGIKSEDAMELNIMEEVFCTENRKTPLKVGSVKSNVGHCEVSSLFMSIVKAIITLESGYIPPNIHYTGPNNNVAALKNGKIQVITEKTPFVGDIIGISSFGLLNAFSHVILKKNQIINNKIMDKHNYSTNMPQLILVSGRNEENVKETLKQIKSHGNNAEFVSLTNDVFTRNINAHIFRSFNIFPQIDELRIDDVLNVNSKRPVWFIFSGMGSQWQGMGTDLMKIPVFADAINKCDVILKPRCIDIKNILTSQNPKLFDNILNSFVGIAAVQIGLVDMLKALDITPDGIIGHSVGELGCAYADGCFTAEEMILAAYARGQASLETEFIPGMMAAIGLGYDQIKDKLPHDIDIACRNSATSCTISGPVESINEFVSQMKSEGVFAKSVNVAGIAFHSRYIQSAGPTLLKYLKDVIKVPKKRSSKWLSSSLPETDWESDLAKYSSPEYHTNNLLSSVLFEDVLNHIPKDAITIEIAPHGLLQAIIAKALPETVTNIPLTKRIYGDSVRFLLTSIGKMYTCGLNPKIKELYPTLKYPVSRGTPSIYGLPFWDHTEKWSDGLLDLVKSGEHIFSLVPDDDKHLAQYQIHGQHIIPFSFILFNVWKLFIEINSKSLYEKPIQFQNLRFKNNVKIHPTDSSNCYIMIQLGSGLFECDLDNEVILSGEIRFLNNISLGSIEAKSINIDKTTDNLLCNVSENEIYSILKNNGFNLGFKNITNYKMYKNIIQGSVKWENDWINFIEGLLKFPFLEHLGTGPIEIPVYMREMFINPGLFENRSEKDVSVNYNKLSNEVTCDGIKILGVKNGPISLPILNPVVVKVQEKSFSKFNNLKCKNIRDFVLDSMDIIMEADKLNLETSGNIILSTPFHYDDIIAKACTNEIKEIMENKLPMNSKTINWENINDLSLDESARFITVSNVNYLQDTTRVLANKKSSFIIVCSLKKLQELKDWKIIAQQEFDNNNCLTLMKKILRLEENNIFIEPTNDNYNLSIWRALETNNSSTGKIYIISKSDPLEGITTHVNEMLQKYKSKKLRFLYILDTNAPDFESNKSFYAHQLSKDLLVNIYNNGDWGYYKSIDLQDLKDDIKVNKNLVLKNFTINNKNKLTVNYLGLNFKDLVLDENTENDFGPFEYSGHINNKTTMGIASINEMSSQIIYDKVLSWPVPSTWSLEEAATVPLAYVMSYYAFNISTTLQKDKTVLVTSGLNPIGQAAISISLDMKCQTYVIVDSDQQAEQLSGTFPELSPSKILINKNNTFDVQLKMITKSKGIDCILNFLSGESFYAAVRALAAHGHFFNFSKSDMKKQRYLGSRIFNFSTSFFSIGSTKLLNESVETKQILRQAFMDGLNKGVIKPFRSHVVNTSSIGNNMFDTMRINASSITYKKVVLSINNNKNDEDCHKLNKKVGCNMYDCHPDKMYLIVGNRGDWLDLAEWLVERGAKRIMIVVKRCSMSSTVCRRFDKLISRNVSIQIESDLHLKTKEESLNWLNYLTSSKALGALFIVNQFDDKKIRNLRYSFEELKDKMAATPFICILSKTEHICAELKSMGFNALNISWDGMSSDPKNTETILTSLDFLLQNSNTSESYSFICSKENNNTSKWSYQMNDVIVNFFPESVNELHLLNNKIAKEAGFIEVATRSPRLSQLKSVAPVFVIPGFKPKSIESLYKQFFYPVFEAQYPEDITSIDNLAETLVNKIKRISDHGYVSIIGECWGGIIALKIAQILESQGILVTVTLLEFDPEFLTGWAERFLSNDSFKKRLNKMYSSSYTEFNKSTVQTSDCKFQSTIVSYHQKILEENTLKALHFIWSLLRKSLESKPQSNRLHSKVLIFRYERNFEFNRTILNDYCIKPPVLSIIPKPDYRSMLEDKNTVEAITKNVTHLYPVGIELSLSEKYKNVYYNGEIIFNI